MTEVPSHVARAATAMGWTVERLLPGGWQQGAWVVTRDDQRAVLKVHTDELDRIEAARAFVDRGVAVGWPTPRWLDVQRFGDDAVAVVTEFVDGVRPAAMDDRVIAQFVAAYEQQRGLGDADEHDGWAAWVDGVVFDKSPDMRSRVVPVFPRGDEIVALVDEIARRAAGPPTSNADLVHGNFNLANAVDDGDRIWLVDVSSIGNGPVVYDVAESVLVAADASVDGLWRYAQTVDPRTFAVCLASVALSMADAFARLGHLHEADARAPSIVANLTRALTLID